MVSKKDYKGYILLVAIIFAIIAIPTIIQFLNDRVKAVIKLRVPDNYEIGQLVILDASASEADQMIWEIRPLTPNFKVYGKTALFSSTEPIDYTLVVVASKGKSIVCEIFTLSYGKKVKEEVTVLTPFDIKVRQWIKDAKLFNNRSAALRLAQSFRSVGRTVEHSIFTNIDGFILATAYANSDALGKDLETWKPFLKHFQNYLENDPPTTIEDHAVVWMNMANALEKIFE